MAADGWWLGIALGAGIGLAYSLARHVTARFAARRRRFMLFFMGGLMGRLGGALVLAALVLLLAPVPTLPFVGALLVTFLAGLAADVLSIHREGPPGE